MEQIGPVTLYQGDCLEVMADIPDGSVDAVVTDPPFGIGFNYGGKREDHKDPASYWDWLRPRYEEMLRCIRPGGFVAVWQTQLYFQHFWEWFGPDIHIYAAAKNFVQIRKIPFNYGYDPVIMRYTSGANPLRPDKPPRNIDYFVANTAPSSGRGRLERAHPCPRPLDQVRVIIDSFTLPGAVVLDPFVGSGTTAEACIRGGRRCIGIEKDPSYFGLACERTRLALGPFGQGALFPAEAAS